MRRRGQGADRESGTGWPEGTSPGPLLDAKAFPYWPAVMRGRAARACVQDGLELPHCPPLEDRSLPHQIRIRVDRKGWLVLGCNCTREPIESRSCWAASEQREVYATWHEQRGITP